MWGACQKRGLGHHFQFLTLLGFGGFVSFPIWTLGGDLKWPCKGCWRVGGVGCTEGGWGNIFLFLLPYYAQITHNQKKTNREGFCGFLKYYGMGKAGTVVNNRECPANIYAREAAQKYTFFFSLRGLEYGANFNLNFKVLLGGKNFWRKKGKQFKCSYHQNLF